MNALTRIAVFTSPLLLASGIAHAGLPSLTSDDGNYELEFEGRVQSRLTYEAVDGGEDEAAFSVARARVGFKGHAYSPDIRFKFQADFGKGAVTLKDYYVDYEATDGVILRLGQFKRPFSRQQITSSGKLELVDRAITDKAFGGARDIGLAVHNDYEKSPEIEWIAGVFNGTGDKPVFAGEVDPMTGEVDGEFSNVPDMFAPTFVVRGGYNHGGIKGYSEADLEGGPLRFAVAASVLAELDADDDDSSSIKAELDYAVKIEGLSSTGGLYLATGQDGAGFGDQSLASTGLHAQVGYLLAGRYQPAVRYALVDPDGDDSYTQEMTVGMSLYSFAHNVAWQADCGLQRETEGADTTNNALARAQLQLTW